jgi:hypothetical protein
MTPESLFRYCFAAVTGTGFGLIVVCLIMAALAAVLDISVLGTANEQRKTPPDA